MAVHCMIIVQMKKGEDYVSIFDCYDYRDL